MKLRKACDLALACDLRTVDEAIANVAYHQLNIFNYDEINNEIEELNNDIDKLREIIGDENITIEEFIELEGFE